MAATSERLASAEYDVVVVGAGAAGCVVAARLAETSQRVCLIEAGPDLRADVPADFRDGWDFPRRYEWDYQSVAADGAAPVSVRRGRLVGGTSWVTRFAVRGAAADFDAWAHSGCTGWTFDDVLPWFRRIESDQDFPDLPWHGGDGAIPVTRYRDIADGEFASAAVQACTSAGISVIDDHNRPGAVGVARMPMSSRDGRRVTTADAYLPLDATPTSLTVLADAFVTGILVRSGEANGVRLSDGSVVRAGMVVLCAGVYGSPLLLMRSGVGPADHLRELGLSVVADLPGVGSNLADHPAVWLDPGYTRSAAGRPPLHTLATFRSSACGPDDAPDLAFWIADPTGDPVESAIEVLLMTPAGRGTVRLASADPAAPPLIQLPQITADRDYPRLAEGLRRAEQVAEHPAIRSICDRPSTDISTPDALREWVRSERYSLPHTVGTCAMGPAPEQGAVVDVHGKVHGVENLAVVDSSIFPAPPSGFPHIVTIMMAERLAAKLATERST